MKKLSKLHAFNLILPVVVLGISSGALTGAAVILYRFLAQHVIGLSEKTYHYSSHNLWCIAIAIPLFFLLAFLLSKIYKKMPTLQGGGISEAMGLINGIFTFKWLRSLIGTVVLSLTNFLIGVPLGNEGPAVQIGASMGEASTRLFGKKGHVWSRYSIAGGSCSGFAAATGAPMTGIIFAIEEMHHRLSPIILIISLISVAACRIVTELLCPILGVSLELFPTLSLPSLTIKEIWIPLITGIFLGLFSVFFLNMYRGINYLINKTLKKINKTIKLFAVMLLTFILGNLSFSSISTGHHLISELFEPRGFSIVIICLLFARLLLTHSANSAGLTGGMFLPTLAICALASAVLAQGLVSIGALSNDYYTLIIVLGIVAGMSGIMSIPFTAILFALEVLSCSNNLLAIILSAGIAYTIAELFHSKSVNELALEKRIERESEGKEQKSYECDVVVKTDAFVIGKQIKDIFWPSGLFVLSVSHPEGSRSHGGYLQEGDILRVCYTTQNNERILEELYAIVGQQTQ